MKEEIYEVIRPSIGAMNFEDEGRDEDEEEAEAASVPCSRSPQIHWCLLLRRVQRARKRVPKPNKGATTINGCADVPAPKDFSTMFLSGRCNHGDWSFMSRTLTKSELSAPRNDTPAIRARGVTKRFGDFVAIERLDLDVEAGECVGLLGPNGAGKSTFIGCLYGVVVRSGGTLEVFGQDPAVEARRIKQRLGVVTQENALDEELTVLENMLLYARFEGLPKSVALPRIEELLAHMALDHKRNATIRTLSGGMKRRLTFVRALLSDPEMLILDEPTTGLDPTVRHLLWERVLSYRQAGKTTLVTTHYMHEAELLCDRVVILNRGIVAGTGAPRDLIAREAPGYVGIFTADREELLRAQIPKDWDLFHQGRQCCIRAPQIEDLMALQQRTGTQALQIRPSNLEDVYLKLTGRELNDDE